MLRIPLIERLMFYHRKRYSAVKMSSLIVFSIEREELNERKSGLNAGHREEETTTLLTLT